MNLKQYVVIKKIGYESPAIWTRAEWETHINWAKVNSKEPLYAAITTFNAGEELKEGGGMRWVQASEPIKGSHGDVVIVKFRGKTRLIENRYGEFWVWITDHQKEIRVNDNQWKELEWLDEYAAQFAGTREDWVSVEDAVPEMGEEVGFIIQSADETYNGRRLGGRYQGFQYGYHEFSTPGCSWSGSHWCKLPNPPNTNI